VFCKKRLQVIENKGKGAKKESEEAATVCRERSYAGESGGGVELT
jgi:hypothetical protein